MPCTLATTSHVPGTTMVSSSNVLKRRHSRKRMIVSNWLGVFALLPTSLPVSSTSHLASVENSYFNTSPLVRRKRLDFIPTFKDSCW